jgi:hypothetical protein
MPSSIAHLMLHAKFFMWSACTFNVVDTHLAECSQCGPIVGISICHSLFIIMFVYNLHFLKCIPPIIGKLPIHPGLPSCVAGMPGMLISGRWYYMIRPFLGFVQEEITRPIHLIFDQDDLLCPSISQSLASKPMHSIDLWSSSQLTDI